MKPVKTIAISAVIILTLCLAALLNRSSASKPYHTAFQGDGFAVLELFTSEGCSSCPPADELLARILHDAGNKPVYVLAYHVDYWDRLGWKDIFSKSEFSKRQYQYSRWLSAQIYTPQLIINGNAEFVGSDASSIKNAVEAALETKSSTALVLQAAQQGNKVNVSYKIKGGLAGNQLLLCVVQKQAISKVSNGENGGRTLRHVQIVHNLYTFELAAGQQGMQQIAVPANFNSKDWEIIGLLQDHQTGAIKAAARTVVSGSVSIYNSYQ
jgi:hypothetical protein